MPYPIYEILKNHEQKKEGSSVVEMSLVLDTALKDQLNVNSWNALHLELGEIIKNYLKEQDIITFNPEGKLMMLILDDDMSSVKELQDVLNYNLKKMLTDNRLETSVACTLIRTM